MRIVSWNIRAGGGRRVRGHRRPDRALGAGRRGPLRVSRHAAERRPGARLLAAARARAPALHRLAGPASRQRAPRRLALAAHPGETSLRARGRGRPLAPRPRGRSPCAITAGRDARAQSRDGPQVPVPRRGARRGAQLASGPRAPGRRHELRADRPRRGVARLQCRGGRLDPRPRGRRAGPTPSASSRAASAPTRGTRRTAATAFGSTRPS